MPKRPLAHVLGDRAATKVTTIFEKCGFAVERLSQDYGEDLLVQTVHEGVVDPSKIWIQVKGRANAKVRRDGTYVERVTIEHALRWARSADLVVMVVWDFHEDRGLWTLPMHQVDQWDLHLLERRTAKLVFDGEEQLDTETAKKLAWQSRLMHYNTLVLRAGEFDQLQRSGLGSTSPRSLVPLIAVNFLRLIGFIGDEQIDPVCRRHYDNLVRKWSARKRADEDAAAIEHKAALLVLVIKVNDVTGRGAPHSILVAAHIVSHRILTGDIPVT